jgi:hypothetical protein
MAVDLIRSCYETEMQFFTGDTHMSVPVTWYFCDENAKLLPHYTRFASGNWASEKIDWTGPGEVAWRPRDWATGEPPGPPRVNVTHAGKWFDDPQFVFGSLTRPAGVRVNKNATIFVIVFYVELFGTGIAGVYDNVGNIYVSDFSAFVPFMPNAQCWIFRARHTLHTQDVIPTIDCTGSVGFMWAVTLVARGLEPGGPVALGAGGGPLTDDPVVTLPDGANAGNLVLTALIDPAMSALTKRPASYTNIGEVVGSGLNVNGSALYRVLEKRQSLITLKWENASSTSWSGAAAAYASVPRVPPPGLHFCGPEKYWREGAPDNAEQLGADIYGKAPCCGDVLQGTCQRNPLLPWTIATIKNIYNQLPDSGSLVGQRLIGWQGVIFHWATMNPAYQKGLAFSCGDDEYFCVDHGSPGTVFASSQVFPPGAVFEWIRAYVDQNEYWDVEVIGADFPPPPFA